MVSLNAFGNVLGRLIVHEVCLNRFSQLWIESDRSSLCTTVFPLHPRSFMGIGGVIRAILAGIRLDLVPHRACHNSDRLADVSERVSFPFQYLNFVSIRFR